MIRKVKLKKLSTRNILAIGRLFLGNPVGHIIFRREVICTDNFVCSSLVLVSFEFVIITIVRSLA